jgi:Na+/H+ antiporter NhaC
MFPSLNCELSYSNLIARIKYRRRCSMKLFIIMVILLASLLQSVSAQSTASAPNRNQAATSRQVTRAKDGQTTKVQKQKYAAKKSVAENGKKETSAQDAAYAAAYKAGTPR